MQINQSTDASVHFGKALFAATFDLMSVPILTSIYQATNSENDNTDENKKRRNDAKTMQVPKSDNAIARKLVTQFPPYTENTGLQAIRFENKSFYPNLNDKNIRDENRNDHNVPTSPV